jgi:hypothetical protein
VLGFVLQMSALLREKYLHIAHTRMLRLACQRPSLEEWTLWVCSSSGRLFAHMQAWECLDAEVGLQPRRGCGSIVKPARTWLGLVAKLGSVTTLILKKLDLDK